MTDQGVKRFCSRVKSHAYTLQIFSYTAISLEIYDTDPPGLFRFGTWV